MKHSRGFSLIELMVGIAIIITSTTIVLSIIVSSFRISNKNTVADTIRQNGNYAISKISRTLQFADSFSGTSTNGTTFTNACDGQYSAIQVVYQGVDTTISCAGSRINVNNSSILENNITVVGGTCRITCRRDLDATPVIGIDFTLQKGANSAAEQRSNISFSTEVKMRNE